MSPEMKDMLKKNVTPGKVLLLAAGFTSSCFIGFWMYETMPLNMPIVLRWIIAVTSAIVVDGVITYTAFSQRQDMWNWVTGASALMGGVLVTLALFYDLHWSWLHVIFIVMGFLFSRFIASERADTVMVQTDTPEALITRLIASGLNNTQIYTIVGGNRNKMITLINTLRLQVDTEKKSLDMPVILEDTSKE
jgi:hypothetical protein